MELFSAVFYVFYFSGYSFKKGGDIFWRLPYIRIK